MTDHSRPWRVPAPFATEAEFIAAHESDRSRNRPAQCDGGAQCWVRFGRPCFETRNGGGYKSFTCRGCKGNVG